MALHINIAKRLIALQKNAKTRNWCPLQRPGLLFDRVLRQADCALACMNGCYCPCQF